MIDALLSQWVHKNSVSRGRLYEFRQKKLGDEDCAKIVSKNLINDQWQRRGVVCTDFLQQIEENCEWLNKVNTRNESWIVQYDPETDGQYWKLKSPCSPRPKKIKSQGHVDLFLRLQRDNAWKVCPTWSDCQPGVFYLCNFLNVRKRNHYVT
jgi:hypothetical protein